MAALVYLLQVVPLLVIHPEVPVAWISAFLFPKDDCISWITDGVFRQTVALGHAIEIVIKAIKNIAARSFVGRIGPAKGGRVWDVAGAFQNAHIFVAVQQEGCPPRASHWVKSLVIVHVESYGKPQLFEIIGAGDSSARFFRPAQSG